jgi:hypothetical protein
VYSLQIDPRPHLIEDSHLWVQLFHLIPDLEDKQIADLLQKRLWTLRCFGMLIKRSHTHYYFEPILEPEGVWDSVEYYKEIKLKYLAPYAKEIQELLGKLN